jgi:hypothetical protein
MTEVLLKVSKRNEKDKFPEKSLLYQNILLSFLEYPNRFYKIKEIARKLLSRHEFKHKSSTIITEKSASKEIEDITPRIQRYLDNMVSWKLLSCRYVKNSNEEIIAEYRLTDYGKFFALLIEIEREKKRSKRHYYIISHLEEHLSSSQNTNNNTSVSKFCLIYFKKCRENKLIEKLVEYIKKRFMEFDQEPIAFNFNDFLTYAILPQMPYEKGNKELWVLWKKSVFELTDYDRELFLYHLKLTIERLRENQIRDYAAYEDIAYDSRGDYTVLIIELKCFSCGKYNFLKTKVIDFLEGIFIDKAVIENYISATRYVCIECRKSKFIIEI